MFDWYTYYLLEQISRLQRVTKVTRVAVGSINWPFGQCGHLSGYRSWSSSFLNNVIGTVGSYVNHRFIVLVAINTRTVNSTTNSHEDGFKLQYKSSASVVQQSVNCRHIGPLTKVWFKFFEICAVPQIRG